jgi:pyruvate,water dikinase
MAKAIAWFEELTKKDIPIVGGKGANLGEMTQAGLPIPPGFVVTAQTYFDYVNRTDIQKKILGIVHGVDVDDTKALQEASESIKKLILGTPMPEDIRKKIESSYRQLCDKVGSEVYVAARSSATAEDLPNASFAGQQATYLDVKGAKELVRAVEKCWASLYTPRAIFYREQEGFKHEDVGIAVVVQQMVKSDVAGVMFTAEPMGETGKMIIEGAYGLGEAVVSGALTPDEYIVDKDNFKTLSKKVSKQEWLIRRSDFGVGTQKAEVPGELRNKQKLPDDKITELAKIGKRIENHYKKPQDIEWAMENGKLYIVQSRAITTLRKKRDEKKEEKPPQKAEVILRGMGASPGVGAGKVKIVMKLEELPKVKEGDVLVAPMTEPDMVPAMKKAAAIVTDKGGMTCHAAIVSRELGVPCVIGTNEATQKLKEEMEITVDGSRGLVFKGVVKVKEKKKLVTAVAGGEAVPVTATKIYVNIAIPEKAEDVAATPADGVGLMREEFIFATYVKVHPLKLIEEKREHEFVDKLAGGIGKIAKAFYPRPVVVRTADFRSNEYKALEGGEKYEPKAEANPMMGWRGCSRYVSPEYEPAFRLELKAFRKVREDMKLKNVYMMLPFVRTVKELKKVNEILEEEGFERGEDFKLWLMAEVPSNIFLADKFAEYCDGFSIGSNDLTQLTLGVDRDSEKLGGMGYFDERNEAVKRAVKHLIEVAHSKGKTVSICGQAPSVYPEFAEFLVECGIDSISVNSDVVLQTKKNIASAEKKILLRRTAELMKRD